MSRTHQVWVIAHPEYKDRVDTFLASNPNDRIQFIWVVPKSRFDYWVPGSNKEKGIRLHYWLWSKPDAQGRFPYRNSIPPEIVTVFERHGFIWGGRWSHYDTMHFEYRPEIIISAK